MSIRASIGFDFGTASVRVLVVDISNGQILSQSARDYEHGVMDRMLPTGESLPADFALQHPRDWLSDAAIACRAAMKLSGLSPVNIVGIGVDFTSCTMLGTKGDGTPLCLLPEFSHVPQAWPKLWKHHAAKAETDRINSIAVERKESWLARYGGVVGIEWFFPKVLETLNLAPQVYHAADVWIEAGDWFVWQLVSGPFPHCSGAIPRSTCQAGYKAMWNSHSGYPSAGYFQAVHPAMVDVITEKMPGKMVSPGMSVGGLSAASAALLGLAAGTPVSAAVIDAHAGVPGAGVAEAGTLVMVMGTSSCHMLNSDVERFATGIAGVVRDGILPGFYGYETGQASVGDAFAWLVSTLNQTHTELSQKAAFLPPGSNGVLALDWLNGCRTPLMDARLTGGFIGLTLGTQPEQLYRALLEATAFGVRWIVDTLREGGIPVNRFVASGGLPAKSPLLMQIYSDVLNAEITLAESDQACGLGAAILGCSAAGIYTVTQAVHAMARQRADAVYRPRPDAARAYRGLYDYFRSLADSQGALVKVMRQLNMHQL